MNRPNYNIDNQMVTKRLTTTVNPEEMVNKECKADGIPANHPDLSQTFPDFVYV